MDGIRYAHQTIIRNAARSTIPSETDVGIQRPLTG